MIRARKRPNTSRTRKKEVLVTLFSATARSHPRKKKEGIPSPAPMREQSGSDGPFGGKESWIHLFLEGGGESRAVDGKSMMHATQLQIRKEKEETVEGWKQ